MVMHEDCSKAKAISKRCQGTMQTSEETANTRRDEEPATATIDRRMTMTHKHMSNK